MDIRDDLKNKESLWFWGKLKKTLRDLSIFRGGGGEGIKTIKILRIVREASSPQNPTSLIHNNECKHTKLDCLACFCSHLSGLPPFVTLWEIGKLKPSISTRNMIYMSYLVSSTYIKTRRRCPQKPAYFNVSNVNL